MLYGLLIIGLIVLYFGGCKLMSRVDRLLCPKHKD